MKFGLSISQMLGFTPEGADVLRFAREAEALGYRSLQLGEHVLIPKDFDDSVYPAGVFESRTPWYDTMVLLAGIAGATTKIRIGTGIAVISYQPPIQRALAVATLDFISGGRMDFGAGLGWMQAEFEALGVPFNERGARTDEYLEVMKLLWSGSDDEFHGKFIDFKGGRINPLPVQKPHPPILIGGETGPALRRIARHGDGFFINWKTLPEFKALLEELGKHMEAAGRKTSDLYMQLGATDIALPRASKDQLDEYEKLGLDEIIFSPKCNSVDEGFATMRGFAQEFMS